VPIRGFSPSNIYSLYVVSLPSHLPFTKLGNTKASKSIGFSINPTRIDKLNLINKIIVKIYYLYYYISRPSSKGDMKGIYSDLPLFLIPDFYVSDIGLENLFDKINILRSTKL
jgi:hypothetical protein